MTRSVLSLAILFAALTGSLLLTKAVRSDTGDDSRATNPQNNGCCPASCPPLYEEEYDHYYDEYECYTPQDNPEYGEPEGNVVSDQAVDETESANEAEAEEYTYEEVDYWYDSETDEYHDYRFAADDATEEMPHEETAEAVAEVADKPEEPTEDEASILVEDTSIATTEEEPACDEESHAYDETYDYEYEYVYDTYEYTEPLVEEEVEATTESVVTEESEEDYDYYWDDCYRDGEENSHFEEKPAELVEKTPESSTEADVDDPDFGYDYWEQYETDYAEGMEQVADDSEQVVEETADELTEGNDEFDYGYEYWDEYDYYYEEAEEAELVENWEEGELGADAELECWIEVALEEMVDTETAVQVAEDTTEKATEESDEFDYEYEYWDEYDYYYEEADEAELVESWEEGELGSDAELECWIEVDLKKMMVASRQQRQSDNDREAILSLARTLDRAGTALQALSRQLTEMANAEVAELPTSGETIQR